MGVSGGESLLVYQWDDLRGPYARKLAKEDQNMPAMQGVPNDPAVSELPNVTSGAAFIRRHLKPFIRLCQ
jgi:hypothetical protein